MQSKKQIILSIISVILLALLVVGATFAYFQAQGSTSKSTNAIVKTYTTDTLSFETGSAISLNLNQENFASGTGNQVGSTFAKAILSANNKTNTATYNYNLYLNISSNTFTYTINSNTPEILLQVKDSSGTALTSIAGLSYKTVTDAKGSSISGFDITSKSGLITLLNNHEITTTSTKTDTWNITITYINYNADQSANAGKSFSASISIDKVGSSQTLASYVISKYTGTQGVNGIYYHNSSLANGAGDNSYRYAGANPNNFVCFGSDASTCPNDNLYRIIGVFDNKVKLIKADYANSNLLGTDGNYSTSTYSTSDVSTYKGKLTSINTYKWSNLASCPSSTAYNDNGLVRLAIAEPTAEGCNKWNLSEFNTVNLNTNYINNIGESWANKIETTTWKVGGNTDDNICFVIPSVAYKNEITTPSESTTYSAKIGLMYASDYGFAASSRAWEIKLRAYYSSTITNIKITNINWMYMGIGEWTISPNSSNTVAVFGLYGDGRLDDNHTILGYATRPVFYLTPSVTYISGTGTESDPIRIN